MTAVKQAEDGERLRRHGIRATRPRLGVLELIRAGGSRHITIDNLHREAMERRLPLSLATIYNTLHQFAAAGMVRRMEVGGRMVFCTNPHEHHHFLEETTGRLVDIPVGQPRLLDLPDPPEGWEVAGVEVVVRIRPAPKA